MAVANQRPEMSIPRVFEFNILKQSALAGPLGLRMTRRG
jgi:hypothetical protein